MEKKIKEVWKPIINYEGLYEVSNLGNVRGLCSRWGLRDNPNIISQHITKKGYKRVRINKNNKGKFFMVHRLVFEAFNGIIPENMEINHKDYDRTNNNINNLELLSHKNNVRYSKNIPITQYDSNGNFIKNWECAIDIERALNIDHRQISDNCRGKQKTCKGFIFKYKEVKK